MNDPPGAKVAITSAGIVKLAVITERKRDAALSGCILTGGRGKRVLQLGVSHEAMTEGS